VFRFATALFNSAYRQIEVLEKTNHSILPPRYMLVVIEKIGQYATNDISHVVEVRETICESRVIREILVNQRMSQARAVGIACAYAVSAGVGFVLWQDDSTYAWK
jgi:hypothetical protein